jgi:hypothetical protein
MNTQTAPTYSITENSISVYYNGQLYPPVRTTHPNFEKLKDALRNKSWHLLDTLLDLVKPVKSYLAGYGDVKVENGMIYYKGEPLHNTLTTRIFALMKEGFEFNNLLVFIANLHQNPSFRAVNELYSFLEHHALPITDDGCFLAYKAVRNDYKDIYSGKFDNSVGQVVSIDRNKVDEDKNQHCSHGLHVGAITYVTQYGHLGSAEISSTGNRLLIVKVNPKDAVAVPGDHNCTKLRVCEYTVIGEINDVRNILDKAVYTANTNDVKTAPMADDEFRDDDDEDNFDEEDNDVRDRSEDDNWDGEERSESAYEETEESYFIGRAAGMEDADDGVPYSAPVGTSKKYARGYRNGYRAKGYTV